MITHFIINPSVTGFDFMKALIEGNRKDKLKLKIHNSRTADVAELCKAFKAKHKFIIGVTDPVDCISRAYADSVLVKHSESDPIFKKFCSGVFPTVTTLGEALLSDNEKAKLIAYKVCELSGAIHAAKPSSSLGNIEDFNSYRGRIAFVYSAETIDKDIKKIKKTLKIPSTVKLPSIAPTEIVDMSDKARKGFQAFLKDDYDVYAECLKLKEELDTNGGK